ncbi:MAG: hypothetical protein JEZ08_02800 [Clostridiales bacterium]|nr:hypothetical protein [Clostridiales bacterium]
MDSETKLPKKHMYIILVSLSFMMLSMSMETMMRVKDLAMFESWLVAQPEMGLARDNGFDIYVTLQLSRYFQMVIVPMALGIHTYFAYAKIRISKLFVFMWTVLLGGGIAFLVVEKQFGSIFFYVNIGVYMILLITILSLLSVIDQRKNIS